MEQLFLRFLFYLEIKKEVFFNPLIELKLRIDHLCWVANMTRSDLRTKIKQ